MFTQKTEQHPTQLKLNTYLVVMASHELDPSEPHPVPADTQVLEMPYPADPEVTKAFLERHLNGWLDAGYYIQSFTKLRTDFEF